MPTRTSAVALALLLFAAAHGAPAAVSVDDAETLSGVPVLQASVPNAIALRATRPASLVRIQAGAEERTRGFNTSSPVPGPDLHARLHYAFLTGSGTEVLLGNSDAFVRANLRLTVADGWRSFVYADLGAADSDFKWQGLAGMHHRLGVDLLGGWRHVTYHFSPGRGLDSLDFTGPYLGASLAW